MASRMPKRPNPRAVKAALTYTISEAADALDVSVGTVRRWARSGLPMMTDARPFLIIGADLRAYVEAQRGSGKSRLKPDELYCLTCKAGRRPAFMEVEITPNSPKTVRVFGLCEVCLGACNRFVSRARMPEIARNFTVSIKGPTKP